MNKKYNKLLAISALLMCVSCGENNIKDELSPIISGVEIESTCKVNEEFDLLDGVEAIDNVDGDITDKIEITILPSIPVNNGIIIATETGDYEVCYSVSDSSNNVTKEYMSLSVLPGKGEKILYKDFKLENNSLEDWEIIYDEGVNINHQVKFDKYNISISNNSLDKKVYLTRDIEKNDEMKYSLLLEMNSSVEGNIYIKNEIINVVEGYNYIEKDITDLIDNNKISIDLSGLAGDVEINISKINIHAESGENTFVEKISSDYKFNNEGNVYSDFSDGSEGELVTNEDSATINITKGSNGNNVWETKLFLKTNLDLLKGQKYIISVDVVSSENIDLFEICYNSGSVEKGIGALYALSSIKNQKQTISYEVECLDNKNDLILLFQLGSMSNGVLNNSITITNLSVKALEGDKITEDYLNVFTPKGFTSHNGSEEGAEGLIYLDNNELIYDVKSFASSTDWQSKIFSDEFELDFNKFYIFEFDVKASESLNGQFVVNKTSSWDPLINNSFSISTDYQTVSLETSDALKDSSIYELIWQFGGGDNASKKDVKISFKNIKVYALDYIY